MLLLGSTDALRAWYRFIYGDTIACRSIGNLSIWCRINRLPTGTPGQLAKPIVYESSLALRDMSMDGGDVYVLSMH